MKNIKKLLVFAAGVLAAVSCDSFFDVNFDDQATLEQTFQETAQTKKYLSHLYSYIPLEEETVGSDGWVVARSDEAMFSFYQWVYYIPYRTGSYSSATPVSQQYFNYWSKFYIAINQCTVFINNVDKDLQDTEEMRAYMKAEARFLRAYYYFCLFRQYGPVFIWGDATADESIKGEEVDRHTVQQNIDFIVSELDKAIVDMPRNIAEVGVQTLTWMGRATKGAAMALKARVLLYAASPLYNGCDLYKGKMQNIRGEYLFPQQADPNKWELAAQAAKDVLDLNMYKLCEVDTEEDEFANYIKSVQAVRFNKWNEETIWGWWRRTSSAYSSYGSAAPAIVTSAPPKEATGMLYGFAGVAPSLKLVDTYPMATTGRYPVTGYEKSAGLNDYSKPIIDPKSGYVAEGFTEGYKQPDAPWADPIKAHNSTINRDARFYADVVPNGFWWPCKSNKKKFTQWNQPVTDKGGPTLQWAASGNYVRSGYAWRKDYPTDAPFNNATDYLTYTQVYPAFRLAEIYLAYAEACNEKPARDEAAALEAINKVRNRAGLNNLEVAYPEVIGNKELLRWCIQREKMVEFAFEAQRHYDACRWMIAKDEYPADNWTLHSNATNYEGVYERVNNEMALEPARFSDKDYLFPLSTNELTNMTNITQNYGF